MSVIFSKQLIFNKIFVNSLLILWSFHIIKFVDNMITQQIISSLNFDFSLSDRASKLEYRLTDM